MATPKKKSSSRKSPGPRGVGRPKATPKARKRPASTPGVPAIPSRPPDGPVAKQGMVPWLCYLIFFAVLNETVFNVATPKVAEDYHLGPAGVSWMMTLFMVTFGIGSVVYGRLSDFVSLKRLIVIGVAVYAGASIMGFLTHASYGWTLVARGLQGAGASAIPALVFVIIARHIPESGRGAVFGIITSVVSLSIGVGPVIGGFVSGKLDWTFLFLLPIPTLLALPFLMKFLPDEKPRPGSLDVPGALLVSASVGTLVVFINFSGPATAALFLVSTIATALWMARRPKPFIDPILLRNKPFRSGVTVGFTLFSMVIGILFVIPLLLAKVHHLNTDQIGLVLFPGAISSVLFGPLGGRLADRRGNWAVVMVGLGLLTASLVLTAGVLEVSPWAIAATLLLLYVGFALFQTALINSVTQTLPMEQTGGGMGLFNLVSIVSGAVGTALVGRLLSTDWLSRKLFWPGEDMAVHGYRNLLLIFALVAIVGAVVYTAAFRKMPMKNGMANGRAHG